MTIYPQRIDHDCLAGVSRLPLLDCSSVTDAEMKQFGFSIVTDVTAKKKNNKSLYGLQILTLTVLAYEHTYSAIVYDQRPAHTQIIYSGLVLFPLAFFYPSSSFNFLIAIQFLFHTGLQVWQVCELDSDCILSSTFKLSSKDAFHHQPRGCVRSCQPSVCSTSRPRRLWPWITESPCAKGCCHQCAPPDY